MEGTKLLLFIRAVKNRAVMMQDYETAAKIREIERNKDGKDDLTRYRTIEVIADELSAKITDAELDDMVGDTFTLPEESQKEVTAMIEKAHDLRCSAESILCDSEKLKSAAFKAIRVALPDIPKECEFSFNHETKRVTIISDKRSRNRERYKHID